MLKNQCWPYFPKRIIRLIRPDQSPMSLFDRTLIAAFMLDQLQEDVCLQGHGGTLFQLTLCLYEAPGLACLWPKQLPIQLLCYAPRPP